MQTQLRDLEYFAAIAEHGQVQRAAVALGLSQPALSKSLRRLEQAMKTKLLKRTPKGVELTSVGAALLARVGKLRLSLDDVTREITDLSEGRAGHLRIATAVGPGLHLVPTACATLLKVAPNVTFNLEARVNSAMLTGLRDGSLDLAVTMVHEAQHEDLIEVHTHDDAWVIYSSANHRLAKRRHLTLADLAQERWTLPNLDSPTERLLSQAFEERGLPPPKRLFTTTYLPARHHLVAETDLLALGLRPNVRYGAARVGIIELRVKDFNATRHGGVVYRKDAYLPPAAFRFIEILKATAKEISKE